MVSLLFIVKWIWAEPLMRLSTKDWCIGCSQAHMNEATALSTNWIVTQRWKQDSFFHLQKSKKEFDWLQRDFLFLRIGRIRNSDCKKICLAIFWILCRCLSSKKFLKGGKICPKFSQRVLSKSLPKLNVGLRSDDSVEWRLVKLITEFFQISTMTGDFKLNSC